MTAGGARNEAKLLQRFTRMVDQQFWRWGCDVKHEDGNLLVRYGFERVPPPDRQTASSSAYYLKPHAGARIVLRSFAVFYGDDGLGGLLLKRFDCRPYRTPAAELEIVPHHESDLPLLVQSAPNDDDWRTLAVDLVEQIIAYETWVMRIFGTKYVKKTLTARQKRPVASADETEAEWRRLVGQISQR